MLAFYLEIYMSKVKKPTKKILIYNSKTFIFEHVSNKVSLSYFLDWAQEAIPKNAEDITLELREEFDDNGDAYINTSLVLNWKEWKNK